MKKLLTLTLALCGLIGTTQAATSGHEVSLLLQASPTLGGAASALTIFESVNNGEKLARKATRPAPLILERTYLNIAGETYLVYKVTHSDTHTNLVDEYYYLSGCPALGHLPALPKETENGLYPQPHYSQESGVLMPGQGLYFFNPEKPAEDAKPLIRLKK